MLVICRDLGQAHLWWYVLHNIHWLQKNDNCVEYLLHQHRIREYLWKVDADIHIYQTRLQTLNKHETSNQWPYFFSKFHLKVCHSSRIVYKALIDELFTMLLYMQDNVKSLKILLEYGYGYGNWWENVRIHKCKKVDGWGRICWRIWQCVGLPLNVTVNLHLT